MPDVRIVFSDGTDTLKVQTGYGEREDSVIERPEGVKVFRYIESTDSGIARIITEITTYPWHRIKAVITSGPNL